MDMGMGCFLMGVRMFVLDAIGMEMKMLMRFIFDSSVEPPDKVGQSKSDKKPSGQTPSE